MRIVRALARTVALGAGLAAGLLGPVATATADGPSFAVRAGRIMPVSPDHPWVIEDGLIVVRDGRIERVGGADMAPPSDLPLVSMPDATIVPGFVAASTSVAGQHGGVPSMGAAYRAADTLDPYDDDPTLVAAGITTMHLNPGWHRMVSGQGAIARMTAGPDGRIMRELADLTINLGPGAANPPDVVEFTIPPSPDQEINPARPQRPASRMTQFLALKHAIARATGASGEDTEFSVHDVALRDAWRSTRPLRIQAQDAVDLAGAVSFFGQTDRRGYLVGGADAADVAPLIADSGMPLVFTMDVALRAPGGDVGEDRNARGRMIDDLAHFRRVEHLALAMAPGRSVADLRLTAAMAQRSGLPARRVLEAITRVPAEILGIDDEVGSLAPGRRADMLVLTGDPLATSTHVQRVYVDGHVVHRAAAGGDAGSGAMVVRAGTVWLGPGEWLRDGEVLIEDGVIVEVGRRVGRPPHARVVDAGPDAFVTPGLIDAHGHLGLRGDRSGVGSNISLARLIGAPDRPEARVASAGVTSVMLAPYALGSSGTQIAAIKTDGHGRADRVVETTAAIAFTVSGAGDPRSTPAQLRQRLNAGKQYVEQWAEYEKKLEEWKKKRAEGKLEETKAEVEVTTEETAEVDPITGTWDAELSGGPLPEPQRGRVAMKLDGEAIEARLLDPVPPTEVRITGTLKGKEISGTIELDTGGMGTPTFQGTIVEEDLIRGTAGLEGMVEVNFEMRRTDKAAVEFKVTRSRRTTGKGGRPLPPEVNERLEPLRALLEKRIPALIEVSDRRAIEAVLDVFVKEFELPIVLLGGQEARAHADRLRESGVGVVLPPQVLRRDDLTWYHQGHDLDRHGVSIAFQSATGDGAATLRDVGTFAVARGLSPEAALAALTTEPARMFGLEDRIGSIAPGCDGDLVIFTGHPFEAASAIERVIINGEEVRP